MATATAAELRATRERLLKARALFEAPPVVIDAAHREKPKPAPEGEKGSPGTQFALAAGGGVTLVEEDYNPDLRGKAFFDQINRMRLSDPQVKAVTSMIKLPLLAADWNFEPAADDAESVDIAAWCEDQLFNYMHRTWGYTLRHALLSLDFGSMPMETVFELKDDPMQRRPMVCLEKLAPRFPSTILEWNVDEHGDLRYLKQQANKNGTWSEVDIEAHRLLLFVHEMEGANWRGTSLLRQARKPWVIKERLERINQVAIEKRASGVDVGTLDSGASQDVRNRDAFETALMSIRTHERGYLMLPEGHDYRIAGIEGQVLDPLPSIKYQDIMILRSILADFLTAGTGDTGSFALVRDRSSFFLMALLGVAKEVTEPINRYLIPRWVRWNWPNVTKYPKLVHSRLDRRDVVALSTALGTLIPQGVITPDTELEREVRDFLDLPRLAPGSADEPTGPRNVPPLSELMDPKTAVAAYRRLKGTRDADDQPYTVRTALTAKEKLEVEQESERIREASKSATYPHGFRAAQWTHPNGHPRCKLCGQEQRIGDVCEKPVDVHNGVTAKKGHEAVEWTILASALDTAESKIVKAYAAVQARQIAKVVEEAAKAIDRGDPDALELVNVPFKKDAADAILVPLIELYRTGQMAVKREMASMGGDVIKMKEAFDPESDRSTMAFLRARARMIATTLAERLRGSLMKNGMDLIRENALREVAAAPNRPTALLLSGTLKALSDRSIKAEAKQSVSEAMNMGRDSVARTNKLMVRVAEYSSVLDEGTCDDCGKLEGRKFVYGSHAYEKANPPYQECEGRSKCRCVMVFTFASESPGPEKAPSGPRAPRLTEPSCIVGASHEEASVLAARGVMVYEDLVRAEGQQCAAGSASVYAKMAKSKPQEFARTVASYQYDSRPINGALRTGQKVDLFKEHIQHLDDATSLGALPKATPLYRGMAMTPERFDDLRRAGSFADDAYASTSLRRDIAEHYAAGASDLQVQVILQVNAKEGTRGAFMARMTEGVYDKEREFLLPRKTQFVVDKIKQQADGSYLVEVSIASPAK